MADKRSDGGKQEPTLELPKLFGRRRKAEPAEARDAPPPPAEEPAPEPAPPAAEDEPTRPLYVDEAPVDEPVPSDDGTRKAARTSPVLPPRLAVALTGLVVGAAGTLLTFGAMRGCEAVLGTDSCGGGPGLLLLVAIFAVMVLLGGALLRMCGLDDPQSTSFLAVGITAVVVMLVLLEAVFSGWMFLAVPLVSMAAYALSRWVTTRFVDTGDDRPGVEVR